MSKIGIIAMILIAGLAAITWVAGTEKTQLDSATSHYVDSIMQVRELDSLHKKIQEDMNDPEFRRKLFEQDLKPEDVK